MTTEAVAATATVDPLQDLTQEISEAYLRHYEGQVKPFERQRYLYLGGIHACERHNFYVLTDGDKRPPLDAYVQATMEAGRECEAINHAKLLSWGFEVIKTGEAVEVHNRKGELIGRGKIDGKVRWRGKRAKLEKPVEIPFEHKKMNPNSFNRIKDVEDLKRSEWTEKYLRQLLLYMYGNSIEWGLFIIDDGAHHWRLLMVYLGDHLDYVERTLRNMEGAFEAAKASRPPERTKDSRLCAKCAFAPLCLPEVRTEAAGAIQDPELGDELARYLELKPLVKEFEDLKAGVDARFKPAGSCTVNGEFMVDVRTMNKMRLNKDLLTEAELKKAMVPAPEVHVKVKRVTGEAKI